MAVSLRIGIVALGLVIAIAVAFGVTTKEASADTDAVLTIDSASMAVGSEAGLAVNALNVGPPGLAAWQIDIVYDPAVVAVVGCAAEQSGACNMDFASNTIRFTGASAIGLVGDTTLAEIDFSCVAEGVSLLLIGIGVLADATLGGPLPIENPSIQNESISCGDVESPSNDSDACDANDGVACETLPALPDAGSGPGPLDWRSGNMLVWLMVAGLIGAGIAWLSTGVAGASLVFIGGTRPKNSQRREPATSSYDVLNEVEKPEESNFQPRMRLMRQRRGRRTIR